METTYADSWTDIAQSCDVDLWVVKWSSAWPIFYGPVILPYIVKRIRYIYIILSEYESVWPDVWPQNNVGHCDLYFIVQWLCLIPWRIFPVWTSLFGIMNQYIPGAWPKYKYRTPWPIFHGPVILCYILKTFWCMNIILGDYDSVWPKNNCMSLRPIYHGPLICLIYQRLFDEWTPYFR